MLARLVGVEAQRHPGGARRADQLLEAVLGLLRAPVGEDGDGALAHAGSPAIQTNVSRLPFGPGSPDSASPRIA